MFGSETHYKGGIVTRRKLALLLALIMTVSVFQVNAFAAGYTDATGHWAEEFINKWSLGAKPILSGYGDGTFAPEDAMRSGDLDIIIAKILGKAVPEWTASQQISREQAMKKIAQAFGIAPLDDVRSSERFADHEEISEDCAGYVYALKELGVVYGKDNNMFVPKAAYKRAEALSVVYHMIGAIADKDADLTAATYSDAVVVRASGVTIKDKTFNGDLVIGQGVGDGDVTLENTAVNGRLLVYGGGMNSIVLKNSKVKEIDGYKNTGQTANVKVEGTSTVDAVSVTAGGKIIITGSVDRIVVEEGAELQILGSASVGEIVIAGANAKVEIAGNAKVAELTVEDAAANTALTVTGNAVVSDVSADAEKTAIAVTGNGEILAVQVAAESVTISGSGNGKVDAVTVASNVEGKTIVSTKGTTVTNNSSAAVVDNSGRTVAAAGTERTTSNTSSGGGGSSSGGSSSGGNSGGSGGTTVTTLNPTVAITAPVTGAVPQATVSGTGYTGTITWSPAVTDKFAANTAYAATVVLTRTSTSYQFTSASKVTVSPAATVTIVTPVAADKLTFTVAYAATGASEQQVEAYNKYLAQLAEVAEADYTAESWALYQEDIKDYLDITAEDTVADIEAAMVAIYQAQQKLVPIPAVMLFEWPNDDRLAVDADERGSLLKTYTATGYVTEEGIAAGVKVKDGLFTDGAEYILEDLDEIGSIVKVTGNQADNSVTVEISGTAATSGMIRIDPQPEFFENPETVGDQASWFMIDVTVLGIEPAPFFEWDDNDEFNVSADSKGIITGTASKVGRLTARGLEWGDAVKDAKFTKDIEYSVADDDNTGLEVTLTGNNAEGTVTVTVSGTVNNSGTVIVNPTEEAFEDPDYTGDQINDLTINITKASATAYGVAMASPALVAGTGHQTTNSAIEAQFKVDLSVASAKAGDSVSVSVNMQSAATATTAGAYTIVLSSASGAITSGTKIVGVTQGQTFSTSTPVATFTFSMPSKNVQDLVVTYTFRPGSIYARQTALLAEANIARTAAASKK